MPNSRRIAAERKDVASLALDYARSAFDRADYVQALTLSAVAPSQNGEASLLRARSAMFLGDDEAALAAASVASRECDDASERLTAIALAATVARRSKKSTEAKRLFATLTSEVPRLAVRDATEPRALYALLLAEDGDERAARTMLEQNIRAVPDDVRSLVLLGALDVASSRYDAASGAYSKALRKLASSGSHDVRLFAAATAGLATAAAETADLDLAKRVRVAFEKIAWTPTLAPERSAALSGLRVLALLEGDTSAAYLKAREAATVAPAGASSALAETHLAVVARILGDFGAEKLQLRRAWDILKATREAEGSADLRFALATFAAEAASAMPAEARKALAAFRTAGGAPVGYPALEGVAALAASRVAEVAGDRQAAIRSARVALATFGEHEMTLRAALVAVDLRRLTGDESFVKTARAVTTHAPKAWFAAELKRSKSPVFALTPAERVVLARLLRGESAKAIGEALERSPFTISNHTRKIFAAFDLNSRSKVIARCVELGITPESIERES